MSKEYFGSGKWATVKVTDADVGEQPKSTRFMTASEIVQATMRDPTMATDRATGKTTGKVYDYMQAVSVAIFSDRDWKAATVVVDAEIDVQWVIAAIQFFHAVDPTVECGTDGSVVITSTGYAA